MNQRERFVWVCRGEEVDYVPIYGAFGAPGMSGGCMAKTHQRLVKQGMPEWVDGCIRLGDPRVTETWQRYWGTLQPIDVDFFPAEPAQGLKRTSRIEGEYEIIECESGALTRQVIDNEITYSMPHFMVYPIRDRESWEFYRDRVTPGELWPEEEIEAECKRFEDRDKPLHLACGGTWGPIRSLMGPERACTILYDEPELIHEIMEWRMWYLQKYTIPLLERLRPEVLQCGEDIAYNHGLLISPRHFREFCAPFYRRLAQVGRECGAAMMAIDSDGNLMELVGLLEECGMNALLPFEVKAGNDLFVLRKQHPEFILMGWLEKEVVNEGNGHMIRGEIMSKVPPLLEKKRYFPNGDHGIQPLVSFENLCKFMTLLHEVTGNPEGEFPRIPA